MIDFIIETAFLGLDYFTPNFEWMKLYVACVNFYTCIYYYTLTYLQVILL